MSQNECLDYCIIQRRSNSNMCVPLVISYPHLEEICDDDEVIIPQDMAEECFKNCQIPCFERTYISDYEATGKVLCNPSASLENASNWCKRNNITVEIYFENNQIKLSKTITEERIKDFEVFSNIGGYTDLWIGLSIIDVVDLLWCLSIIILYPFLNIKKKQTRKISRDTINKSTDKKKELDKNIYTILQKSQISSIADISSSRSKLATLLKILLCAFSLSGFMWQSKEFWDIYTSYTTVRKEISTKPLTFERPAITICPSNVKSRTEECEQHPEKCLFVQKELFCSEYPQYCKADVDELITGVYTGDVGCPSDCMQWDSLSKTYSNIFISMTDQNLDIGGHGRFETLPYVSNRGQPVWCKTYGSQVWDHTEYKDHLVYAQDRNKYGVYDEAQNISAWYNWEMEINVDPDDGLNPIQNSSIYMAIHDGKRRVNPFKDGFHLKSITDYQISVTEMIEINRLPSPYETNCTDYVKAWKENNRTGPLSTLDCIEHCQFSYLYSRNMCIPRSIGIIHWKTLCPGDETVSKEIVNYCIDHCGTPCLERIYKYNIIKYDRELIPEAVEFDEEAYHGYTSAWFHFVQNFESISISMNFKNYHHTLVTYEPRYNDLDFFCNIGGYLGIWIGFSLITMIDLLYLTFHIILKKIYGQLNINRGWKETKIRKI